MLNECPGMRSAPGSGLISFDVGGSWGQFYSAFGLRPGSFERNPNMNKEQKKITTV